MVNMGINNLMRPVLAMVAVNFGFSILNVLTKKVLDEGFNHLVFITYRQSIAAIFLAPIAYYWERKSRPKLTVSILCQLFFSALAGLTLTFYLFLLGLKYTSATFSCAFLNMVPVITFLLALPVGQETVNMKSKTGRVKVLGGIICMSGAILLILYQGFPITNPHSRPNTMTVDKGTQRWIAGSMLLMAGSTAWASWFLMQAKIGKSYPCQYSSTAILSFFSAIQSALVTLIMKRDVGMWILKDKLEILTITYTGVVGSGLAYVVMSWCVRQKGPVFTSAFTPLIQIFAAVLDYCFLHEQIYLGSVLGSILVILGLYILLWGKSIEADECQLKEAEVVKQDEHGNSEFQVSLTINSTSH